MATLQEQLQEAGTERLPTTRKDVLACGSRHYFSGEPCVQGHIEIRYVGSGSCMECSRNLSKRRYRSLTPDQRERVRQLQRESAARASADPVRRAKIRELDRKNRRSAHRIERKRIADRERHQRDEVKALHRERSARYYHDVGKNDPTYIAKLRQRAAEWRRENAAKLTAMMAERRFLQRASSTAWEGRQFRDQITAIYEDARRITASTGISHHVDHIIPLKGAMVCGLHVPWNLRVITASENCAKSNRLIEAIT